MIKSALGWVLNLVLVVVASTAEGQPLPERLRTLEERVRAVELRQELSDPREAYSEAYITAFGETAKAAIESYNRGFNTLTWLVGIVGSALSFVIALVVGGFTFFGVRQYQDVVKRMEKQSSDLVARIEREERQLTFVQGQYSDLMTQMENEQKRLTEVRSALDADREAHSKSVQALIDTTAAFAFTQALASTDEARRENLLRLALRRVRRTVHETKPDDPRLMGWAYHIVGWIQRRMDQLPEALESLEQALRLDPGSDQTWYNAACYACVLGRSEDALNKLSMAITMDAEYKKHALSDPDFAAIREHSRFQALTS